jgi:hypothetical protein
MARRTFIVWLLIICIFLMGCAATGTKSNRAIYSGDTGGYRHYEAANAADVLWTLFGVSLAVGLVIMADHDSRGGSDYDTYYK